eukprot:TRINITY_DN7_c0_g2_i3.p1 TRINITY_DN7_c0_g2~~TRINITY_DN7_c0_g2_i3.p1  ORF type:complete len:2024 (+),score=574.39 TRINITY_DN7_c0_g2_i3:20-6091(+)
MLLLLLLGFGSAVILSPQDSGAIILSFPTSTFSVRCVPATATATLAVATVTEACRVSNNGTTSPPITESLWAQYPLSAGPITSAQLRFATSAMRSTTAAMTLRFYATPLDEELQYRTRTWNNLVVDASILLGKVTIPSGANKYLFQYDVTNILQLLTRNSPNPYLDPMFLLVAETSGLFGDLVGLIPSWNTRGSLFAGPQNGINTNDRFKLNLTQTNTAPVLADFNITATENQQILVPIPRYRTLSDYNAASGAKVYDQDWDRKLLLYADPSGLAYTTSKGSVNFNNIIQIDTTQQKRNAPQLAVIYTPNANQIGLDSFPLWVSDTGLDSNTITVYVNIVNAVNSAPVATGSGSAISLNEDTTASGTLVATDLDFDPLTFSVASPPQRGAVAIVGSAWTYTPRLNENGADSFSFVAADPSGALSAAAVMLLDIVAVPDAPVAANTTVSVAQGGSVSVSARLLTSDPDSDPNSLTWALETAPTRGTVQVVGAVFQYTPNSTFAGTDRFTWRVTDETALFRIATVTVTVTAVNHAPVAAAQAASINEDTVLRGVLGASDSDGDALVFQLASLPASGSVAINASTGNFTYTPAPNFFGTDSFAFLAREASGQQAFSAAAVVTVTVAPVPDAPVAVAQTVYGVEDEVVPGIVLAGTDADGTTAFLFAEAPCPACALTGTPVFSGPNVTFVPAPDFAGTASFEFRVTDPTTLTSAPATVTIVLAAVNDAPRAASAVVACNEDAGNVAIALQASDPDSGPETFVFRVLSQPALGTLVSVNTSTGAVVYRPDADASGTDSFVFDVSDGVAFGAPAVVVVEIAAVNDAPVPQNDTYTIDEDGYLQRDFAASDVDSPSLVYAVASVVGGQAWIDAGAAFTFVPNGDRTAPAAIWFTVSDGALTSTGVVTVLLTPINDAPQVYPLTVVTAEDTVLARGAACCECSGAACSGAVGLVAYDVDSSSVTWRAGSPPQAGAVVVHADGSFEYTPGPDFSGTDAFGVVASDGVADSVEVDVVVEVTPVDDPPAPVDSVVLGQEDVAGTGTVAFVDVDGSTGVVSAAVVGAPVGVAVTFVPGTLDFSYVPAANRDSDAYFFFRVSDSTGTSAAQGRVTVRLEPVNDAPSAVPLNITTLEDTPVSGQLAGADVEPGAVSFVLVSQGTGTVMLNDSGSFVYTPAANANGVDTFLFWTVDAGGLTSAPTAVRVAVTAVNDAPVLAAAFFATATGQALVASLAPSGSDVDGDALTFVLDAWGGGTVDVALNGTFVFVPASGFTGLATFSAHANDGALDSAVAVFTVSVHASSVVVPPLLSDASVATDEDTAVDGAVTALYAQGLVGTARFSVVQQPLHGRLVAFSAGTGTFTYQPDANFNGADAFRVIVEDVADNQTVSVSNQAVVSVDVVPVNDAPVAVGLVVQAVEEEPLVIQLGEAVSDVDGDAPVLFELLAAPTRGSLSFSNATGLAAYLGGADVFGNDTFVFRVSDGIAWSQAATVRVVLADAPDAPTAVGSAASGFEDTPLSGTVTASDPDAVSDLIFVLVEGLQHGTAVLDAATGAYTLTPAANYYGTDSFVFQVRDSADDSAALFSGLVRVAVTWAAVNDAPVMQVPEALTTSEWDALPVFVGVTDVEGDAWTLTLDTPPAHGSVVLDAESPGLLTYTPGIVLGEDTFVMAAADVHGGVTRQNVTVMVTAALGFFSCATGATNYSETAASGGAIDGRLVCDGFPDCAGLADESKSAGCQVPLDQVYVGVLLVVAALIVGTFSLFGFLLANRNNLVLKYTSPLFQYQIVVGAVVGYLSVLVWMPAPSAFWCQIRVWLPNLAFMLMFGNLLLKEWRTYYLFNSASSGRRVSFGDRELLRLSALMVLFEIVFLAVWGGVDPLRPVERVNPITVAGQRELLHTVCGGDNPTAWLGAVLGYKGLMLVFGAWLATKTRNMDQRFHESKYIATIVYTWLIVLLLILPLLWTSATTPQTQFMYLTLGLLVLVTITLTVLFVPKAMTLLAWSMSKNPTSNLWRGEDNQQTELERHNSTVTWGRD